MTDRTDSDRRGVDRREILKSISTLGVGALLPGVLPASAIAFDDKRFASSNSELIREENARQGTRDWMLTSTRIDDSTKYRCPWIEGYASQTSVAAGDEIALYVSCNPESKFNVDIYRSGFYGGLGGRLVASFGSFQGRTQEEPDVGEKRVRECRWEACTKLTIPSDWPSGVYVAKLTAVKGGLQSYITFIVKDDRRADFLFQCSDTTWSAYNRWPSQFSLYDDGESTWYWGADVQVSFDRPYGKYCQIMDAPLSTGSGEWFCWEFPIAFWMESQGCDVSYISNLDTHADGASLLRGKGLLSVGHDEYYSLEMFNNVRQAIRDGLNVAFLSGNTCCGLIEVHSSSGGRPNRIIERVDRFGPRDEIGDSKFVEMKSLPRTAPSEADLIGARSTGPITGSADWTCQKPDHWIFEKTGMKAGDGIKGLVGWEWHGDPAEIPNLEIVAQGKTSNGSGDPGTYTSTIYPGPKGNFVFNASTCWWGDGLSEPPGYVRPSAQGGFPQGPDPRVQQITRNLLTRISS